MSAVHNPETATSEPAPPGSLRVAQLTGRMPASGSQQVRGPPTPPSIKLVRLLDLLEGNLPFRRTFPIS